MSIISIFQISKLKWGCNSSKTTQQIGEWRGQEQNSSVLPGQSQNCYARFNITKAAEGTFWGEMPEEDFLVRSLEKSERTLTCQVLERSKSRLYFHPLLKTNQHIKYLSTEGHMNVNVTPNWQRLQKLRYDLKSFD